MRINQIVDSDWDVVDQVELLPPKGIEQALQDGTQASLHFRHVLGLLGIALIIASPFVGVKSSSIWPAVFSLSLALLCLSFASLLVPSEIHELKLK